MFDRSFDKSFMVLFAGAALLIGSALFSQYVLGWYPCPMCFWQREPHYVIFAVFVVTWLINFAGKLKPPVFAVAYLIACIAFLVAMYRAGFHVGVEQLWWKGWEVCGSGGGGSSISAMDLLAAPTKDCTVPTMLLPGISMALGHFLALGFFLMASLVVLFRKRG